MTIRPLDRTDLELAAQLFADIIGASPYYNDWAKREELAARTPPSLLRELERDPENLIGAFHADQLLGVVHSSLEAGLAWLEWIVVDASVRGQGIGGQLVQVFEASAKTRGAHKIWCDSRTGNAASQGLLERHGYRIAVTVERHWYGLDYHVWEKALT